MGECRLFCYIPDNTHPVLKGLGTPIRVRGQAGVMDAGAKLSARASGQ